MRARCQVTGKAPLRANHVSHSHQRTPRRQEPNLQHKSFWVPTLGRRVRLRVSAQGLRVIDARGIDAVVGQMLAAGQKI